MFCFLTKGNDINFQKYLLFKDGEKQTIENDKTKKIEKDISLAKELQLLVNSNES